MKIDNECVRDILFAIEKNSTYSSAAYINTSDLEDAKLSAYGSEKLNYHIRYLYMKELIFNPLPHSVNRYDLTPEGHEFLSNIRDDNNWHKIKSVSASIGFAGLKVISAIAEGVATAAINQKLGFTQQVP